MAVFTHIDDDTLAEFIFAYDVGEVVFYKGIAEGVENTNYLVQTTEGTWILTLFEERRTPAEDLPFFLGLMDHLATAGIPCPRPIRARDGVALRILSGRPAVLVSFLKGVWPKRVNPLHCEELGAGLARMHLAGQRYEKSRPNPFSISAFAGMLAETGNAANSLKENLKAEVITEIEDLSRNWPQNLPAGIIHGDLFPDNVFFLHGKLSGMIDFYFACTDLLAYDIAVCLNAWCFEGEGSFNITKARRLLESYQQVRPLSAEEVTALPVLARGAAMRFFLSRLHDWKNTPEDALITPKNPGEYLEKLTFHRGVSSPGEYGLDVPARS